MANRKLRKQFIRMWNENPHCHWCGRLTTLEKREDKKLLPETATLDHLYSRLDPRRKVPNRSTEKRRLIACFECNQRRCQEEVKAANAEKARRRNLSEIGIQTIFE